MENILYYLIGVSILGMAYSFWKYYQVNKIEETNFQSTDISIKIKKTSTNYIKNEYKLLLLFVVSIGSLLFLKAQSEETAKIVILSSYVLGAGLAGLSAYLGTKIVNIAGVKVSNSSGQSFSKSYKTAISGSTSISIANVSLLVAGISFVLILYSLFELEWNADTLLSVLAGFVLGGTTVSLFTRFGGGLFARGAEMADDQIQKAHTGIVNNSLPNAASWSKDTSQIVAYASGIGTEIFTLLGISIIAAILLGAGFLESEAISNHMKIGPLIIPLAIASVGILSSSAATLLIKANSVKSIQKNLFISEIISAIVLTGAAFFISKFLLPSEWEVSSVADDKMITTTYYSIGIFWSALTGVTAAIIIGIISNFFTGKKSNSIKISASESAKGTEINILSGFQNGFMAMALPLAFLFIVPIISYYFAGMYGFGIALVCMLGNAGFYYTVSTYAPISNNADAIAQKAGMSVESNMTKEFRQVGNQNLATIRSYLVFGVSLSAIALLSVISSSLEYSKIDFSSPKILAGLLFGGLIPFIVSATSLASTRKISTTILTEAERQFNEIPALSEAKEILDKYKGEMMHATEGEKAIVYSSIDDLAQKNLAKVSAKAVNKEIVIPGFLAIAITFAMGHFGGIEILSAYLVGTVTGSILLSLFLVNSGNAMESTKIVLEGEGNNSA